MKFGIVMITSAAALALAGCGSAEDESKPRKGKYKPEVELQELDIPGLTEEAKAAAKEQMQSVFAAQSGNEQCMGGGKADWKDAAKEISKGLGSSCETLRDNGTDSSADLEMKCAGTAMGDVVLNITGEAQSESFEMQIGLDMTNMPVGGDGKMKMKVSAERIGDC